MSSVSGVGSTTNDLASAIIKNFDKDGDGSLSANEFGSFLKQLVGDLGQSGTRAPRPRATSAGTLATLFPSPQPPSRRVLDAQGADGRHAGV